MISRNSIETLSLEERISMQNEKAKPNSSGSTKSRKRANKNRPREMSSKIPVASEPAVQIRKKRCVDPRFDSLYGEFEGSEFSANYGFLDEIKKKEMTKLQKISRTAKNPAKREEVQGLLRRMADRERELKRVRELKEKVEREKSKVVEDLAQGRPSRFKTKTETKLNDLVGKFSQLKKQGKLMKYLKKKTKSKGSMELKLSEN